MQQWYVKTADGNVYGPMETAEVRAALESKQIPTDAMARKGEDGPWIPVVNVVDPAEPGLGTTIRATTKGSGGSRALLIMELALTGVILTFLIIVVAKLSSIRVDVATLRTQVVHRETNILKWEYRVVYLTNALERIGSEAFKAATITPSDDDLDKLGEDGWELATSYLETETAYPNFGNEKYVTGIQPNVRPQRVVLIFKRPILERAPELAPAVSDFSSAPSPNP